MSLPASSSLRLAAGLFVLSAVAIVAAWARLGAPVEMPQAPLAKGEKLYCVSYAPFRGSQSPLDPNVRIEPWQIDDDIARLSALTDCVRTYSIELGLDHVVEVAQRHGMKVLLGLWVSNTPTKTRVEMEKTIALANQFPNTVRAIIVGNEVLLRGDLGAADLIADIREVKSRVHVPVTYADVWEFWLRNRDVASAVDFVTVHILPYWEDFPIPADQAAFHVEAIRRRVVEAFPGKEILIGEVGWPSHGRMREGALPSPSNQARVVQDVLALAKRENFHVNLIEAFDQPWKRYLEGTVGGYWGFLSADTRAFKFDWGDAVSDHPSWRWQAAGGVLFALLVFGAAVVTGRKHKVGVVSWTAVAISAIAGGVFLGWTVENVPIESLGIGGWVRSLAFTAVAFAAALVTAAALVVKIPAPSFAHVLAKRNWHGGGRLAWALGVVLIAVTVLALQVALGLVFDPRYKDLPFAPFAAAVVPFFVHGLLVRRGDGKRGAAEIAAAGLLVPSVGYIVFNESFANWQALWLCVLLALLAFTLARVRGVPG
ncbi:MAG TPA: beta-(1-6) glucans synthase [Pseudolabrys sp.]|nr:beta-(1-6) glucans synthase [Pseudolabrys sp.]